MGCARADDDPPTGVIGSFSVDVGSFRGVVARRTAALGPK